MELSVGVSSAGVSGSDTTYGLAGLYLWHGLGEYGAAVGEVEVTACFRGGPVRNPSLQSLFDRYHAEFLPSLPYVRFFRAKRRVVVSYESAVADGSFICRTGPPAADVFTPALAELADRLRLVDARFKRSDDFDLRRFHDDVAKLVAEAPRSQAAVEALQARLDAWQKQRVASLPWWERAGVDWGDFHPEARRMLDDPLFWDCADDYAPHGNDTGADLLADFKAWNRKHPAAPAHEMARALLDAWGVRGIDPDAADEESVRTMLRDEPTAFGVVNEAMVAAAFAALKLRGWCDNRTRELALRAVARERLSGALDGARASADADRVRKFALLEDALRRAPGEPPENRVDGAGGRRIG